MARLHFVKSARVGKGKARPKCGSCSNVIEVGQPYYWWANRIGRSSSKHFRCEGHRPKPSEMAGSQYQQASLAAQEEVTDALGSDDLSDLSAALEGVADTIESDCAEALRQSAENIEEGFGHATSQSDELRERADAFDEWARALRDAADQVGSAASEVAEIEDGHGDEGCPEGDELGVCTCEDDAETKRGEARQVAEDALRECPE